MELFHFLDSLMRLFRKVTVHFEKVEREYNFAAGIIGI